MGVLGDDGRIYQVLYNTNDPNISVTLLSQLNARIIKLLRFMQRRQYGASKRVQLITKRLLRRYNPDTLVEHIPHFLELNTAYTSGPGDQIGMCLRHGGNGLYHDIDLITFVAIHELAHVALNERGHSFRFWCIFKHLLGEASAANVLAAHNYEKDPQKYCNMDITYNPLYDEELPKI